MNKREFLRTSAILGAGTLIAPTLSSSCSNSMAQAGATASLVAQSEDGTFLQPDLGYDFNALEPHVDAMTMEVHYGKHHAGYTSKFNDALVHADLHSTDIYKIFASVSSYGNAVRNNGGGYFNHNLYWKFMSPDGGGEPVGALAEALAADFGSFAEFKDLFSATAASHFGSGWGWLLLDANGKLVVSSLPNQDNPLMDVSPVQGTPLLNIDVWEHAYYLRYQNMRNSYIEAYWNIIDWGFVSALYEEALSE
ncbi:MAG: superoxide dismutase [Bacteroidales bacterium]|nr:superoxide dismutase [Bacteroidales bacterium]